MSLIDADMLTKKISNFLDACKNDNCISSDFEEGLDYALSEIIVAPIVMQWVCVEDRLPKELNAVIVY